MSRSRSRLTYSIVLATNASSWDASPALASVSAVSTVSAVCSVPLATTSSPRHGGALDADLVALAQLAEDLRADVVHQRDAYR